MTSAAIKSYYKACVGHSPFEKDALADLMDIANNMPPNPAPLTAWKKKTHADEQHQHPESHHLHTESVASVESAAASVASAAVEEVTAAHKTHEEIHKAEVKEEEASPVKPVEEVPPTPPLVPEVVVTEPPVPAADEPVKQTVEVPPHVVKSKPPTPSPGEVAAKARATALQYLQMARAFYDKGWLDKSLAEIEKALRKSPDLIEALALRGEVHADLGKYDKAVSDLSKVYQHHQQLDSRSAESERSFNGLLDLALKLDELRLYDHSASLFRLIHSDARFSSKAGQSVWLSAATAFAHGGDYQLAITALDSIAYPVGAALSEERKKVLKLKSEYYGHMGQKDKAEAVWAEVVQASESLRDKGERSHDMFLQYL